MQIRKVFALMGPNIWANFPVLEAWVDLGHYEDFPSNMLPGFNEKLTRWLPSLVEHRCSVGERGGFLKRLADGTWLGHVLEHVTLELQTLTHMPLGYGRARETTERGVYKVVVEFEDPRFAETCLHAAHSLIMAAAEGREFALEPELRRLREAADHLCLGPSTQSIVTAAEQRKIPVLRLTEHNLIQLGYGKAQRRIWTAETDRTQAIGESIAADKELTRKLLSSVGVPVPSGRAASSAEDAWAAASELDGFVVVKPADGNKGRGVSIRIAEREEVMRAYERAAAVGSSVVVESFIPGTHYRVLVVGERAVAASGGEVVQVKGDGKHSINELIAIANRDPRRGDDAAQPLAPLFIDDIARALLTDQGLDPKSVPQADQSVLIRYNGDLTVDATDRMHPDVAATCVLAAQTVGLDIAGIDLVAEDIAQPLETQGGAIVEVNSSPGLIMHLKPLVGEAQPVGEAIVEHLFGKEQNGRVPIVAISGTTGKTTTAAWICTFLEQTGKTIARADSRGLAIGARWLSKTDAANAASGRRALINPAVDAYVFEVSETSVLDAGLAFDRCDVATVLNLGVGAHLGRTYANDLATIAKTVRAPVDVVLPTGYAVLNADDPDVTGMAEYCKGNVLYFGLRSAPPLREHLRAGGRAVVRDEDRLLLLEADQEQVLVELSEIACPVFGLPAFLVEDLMAALATGAALGLSCDLLRRGVECALNSQDEGAIRFAQANDDSELGSVWVLPASSLGAVEAWTQHLLTDSRLRAALAQRALRAVVGLPVDSRIEDAEAIGHTVGNFTKNAVFTGGSELAAPAAAAAEGDVDPSLLGALSRELEFLRPGDLLCVLPATRADCFATVTRLTEAGLQQRGSRGITAVGNS